FLVMTTAKFFSSWKSVSESRPAVRLAACEYTFCFPERIECLMALLPQGTCFRIRWRGSVTWPPCHGAILNGASKECVELSVECAYCNRVGVVHLRVSRLAVPERVVDDDEPAGAEKLPGPSTSLKNEPASFRGRLKR